MEKLLGPWISLRFAPQRFNTLTDISKKIVLKVRAINLLLVEVVSPNEHDEGRAENILKHCSEPSNLLLLGLVAELAECPKRFSSRFDGVENNGYHNSRLMQASSWLKAVLFVSRKSRGVRGLH